MKINNAMSNTICRNMCGALLFFIASVHAASFTAAAPMPIARAGFTATLLQNGKVLVVGGDNGSVANILSSAEIYDPILNTWSGAASMTNARFGPSATLLQNGKVLVVGGYGNNGVRLKSVELYDPATNTWSTVASLSTERNDHIATLLQNGKVLVVGLDQSAEIYDAVTNTWSTTGSLTTARGSYTVSLLQNGKVLVAGGNNGNIDLGSSTELFDPSTSTWSPAASLNTGRYRHTATLLSNGKVFVTGGQNNNVGLVSSAEIYDPASNTWITAAGPASERIVHTATLLQSGKVLVAGGNGNPGNDMTSAEIYDSTSNSWNGTASLITGRHGATALLLRSGKVFVLGGSNVSLGNLTSTELYDPLANTPPVATVQFNSASPKTNDTLTATATKSDADGDTVTLTYVWKVNGTVKKTTAASASLTDTFDLSVSGNGDKGDTVTIEVTPNDGTVDGIKVTATATIVNSPPAITSQINAMPNPNTVRMTVTLTVAAFDLDNDSISYNWDFGDGTTGIGASVNHIYVLAEDYTAMVTISDGVASVIRTVLVTVNPAIPVIGYGPDSDGDGFSDTIETANSFNSLDYSSTPFANVPVISPAFLNLAKPTISLNFSTPARDSITFSGTLPVPGGFSPDGKSVFVAVGNVLKSFLLNGKAMAKVGGDSIKITIKSTRGTVLQQTSKYTVSLTKGSFSGQLADAGLTDTTDMTGASVHVPFTVHFDTAPFHTLQTMSYTVKKGTTGKAK